MRASRVAFGILAVGALTGCSSQEQTTTVSDGRESALCAEYCGQIEELTAQRCTTPEIETCADMLTDKVLLAGKVDDAMGELPLSEYTEYIHKKAGVISTEGAKFAQLKCYEVGFNLGDRLYECRMVAKDVDDRFAELLDLVQDVPA